MKYKFDFSKKFILPFLECMLSTEAQINRYFAHAPVVSIKIPENLWFSTYFAVFGVHVILRRCISVLYSIGKR
jgi:hypothetical protein